MNSSIVHRLLWGALIVVVGVVFLLNQVGLISMDIGDLFRTYWPVFLIVFGLQGMLLQQVWWNLITVLVGCYFLGRNLGYVEWGFGDFIRILGPVAIILFGLSMIFRGNRPTCRKSRSHHQKHEGWNPVDPHPPTPPMPPGPPPAPPELDDFERRSGINLGKEPKAEHADDYGYSDRKHSPPPLIRILTRTGRMEAIIKIGGIGRTLAKTRTAASSETLILAKITGSCVR